MKYIVFVWTTKSGEFVDKLEFDSKDEAETAVRSMQAQDGADGFPNIYRYEIQEQKKHIYKPECMCIRCQGWRRVCSEIGIPAVHCLQYERFGIEN